MARITAGFNIADIKKQVAQKKELIEQVILRRFQRIGEAFIANARSNDTYRDQTGNLRSSIGYVILKNGEQLFASFPGDKSQGKTKAGKVVDDVKDKYPQGFVLIVVAGMEYAAYVEAMGYDVLTASGIAAENDLRKAVEQISKKIR